MSTATCTGFGRQTASKKEHLNNESLKGSPHVLRVGEPLFLLLCYDEKIFLAMRSERVDFATDIVYNGTT